MILTHRTCSYLVNQLDKILIRSMNLQFIIPKFSRGEWHLRNQGEAKKSTAKGKEVADRRDESLSVALLALIDVVGIFINWIWKY